MNRKPILARPSVGMTLFTVTLSLLITTVLLTGVTELFLLDGTPFQQVVIADRACSEAKFVSERAACVRAFLAASYHRQVASR